MLAVSLKDSKIWNGLMSGLRFLEPADTSPRVMATQLVALPLSIWWQVYPSANVYGTVEQAIATFVTWLVTFHLLAYMYRHRWSLNLVRSLDYWYLTIGLGGVLMKLHEFNLHGGAFDQTGVIHDLLSLSGISEHAANHIAFNAIVLAIALRLTKTTMEMRKWYRS